jgi:opacity protein-like surface antigen
MAALALFVTALLSLAVPPLLHAADNDQPRFYMAIRAGAVIKSSHEVAPGYQGTLGGEDVIGLSAGMNFNKYVGAEISMDRYEFILNAPPKSEKAAEYSVSPFLMLLRLRYPLLDDRVVPYVLGGGGVGFVQVDDKFPPIGSTSLKKNDFSPAGALGGGVEYFIANNLAFGLEAKYLFHQAALGVNGQDNRTNLNGLLWGGSMRVYFSEDSAGTPALPSMAAGDRARFYLAVRTGTSIPTHRTISPQGSLSGVQGLHFGSGSFGVNLSRYWGLELAVESMEQNISVAPYGRIGEYTHSSIVPQVRVMYPVYGDRLVPYAVGGVGVGIAEFGDQTPEAQSATIGHSQTMSVVGTAGVGLDYFLLNNVAINLETKYRIFPSATLEINGIPYTVNLSGVLISAGLRVFFN